MERRQFTREFKLEAVRLIKERGDDCAARHRCPGDRSSQYTSEQFQRLMADYGVVCSMSRSGNVWVQLS